MNEALSHRLVENAQELTALRASMLAGLSGHDRQGLRDDVLSLAGAVRFDEPDLFGDYAVSTGVALVSRGVPARHVKSRFKTLAVSSEQLLGIPRAAVEPYLQNQAFQTQGLTAVYNARRKRPELNETTRELVDAMLHGDLEAGARILRKAALKSGSIESVYIGVVQPCMAEVGRLWEVNEITTATEHVFSEGIKLLLSELHPLLQGHVTRNRVLVAAAPATERHELGLRALCDFFRMQNWYVHFVGANVPVEDLAGFVIDLGADVLALSATVLKNLQGARHAIELVRKRRKGATKILVGGRLFMLSPELWKKLGADATAVEAAEALSLAEAWT